MSEQRALTPEQLERFAVLDDEEKTLAMALLAGLSHLEGMRMAQPGSPASDSVMRQQAATMVKRVGFVAFMTAIHAGILSDAIMTRQEALERLSEMARGKLSSIISFSRENFGTGDKPDMRTAWDLTAEFVADPSLADNIAKMSNGLQGPKIEMYSAVGAIKQLSTMLGWNAAQKVDHTSVDGSMTPAPTSTLDFSKMSSETIHELINLHYAARTDGK